MSSAASWAHAKRVFEAALDVPEADRAAFVDTACAANPALRDEVLSLLTWHNGSTGFLETPASQVGDMPDVSAVELNEAFAVQSIACVDAWQIDPEIVNSKGGAIAIGHPLGASGGRILGTLAARLQESGGRYGVAAICIGVGQALAVVLENVSGARS